MKWYYLDETGEVAGPVSESSLLEMEASGVLGSSKVCREGTEDWVPVAVALEDGDSEQPPDSVVFKFNCPHCDQHIAAESADVGLSTQCPACEGAIQVPGLPAEPGSTHVPKVSRGKKLGILAGAAGLVVLIAVAVISTQPGSEKGTSDLERTADQPDDTESAMRAYEQFLLGAKYYTGDQGLPQDFREAAKLLHEAALQGIEPAQTYLGLMYLNGEGVEQDDGEAMRWWTYAAEQGFADAQRRLGVAHSVGLAGKQDRIAGYMWLNLASTGENENTASESREWRDKIAREMTRAEIQEAQRLSRKWKPKQASELNYSRPVPPGSNDDEASGSKAENPPPDEVKNKPAAKPWEKPPYSSRAHDGELTIAQRWLKNTSPKGSPRLKEVAFDIGRDELEVRFENATGSKLTESQEQAHQKLPDGVVVLTSYSGRTVTLVNDRVVRYERRIELRGMDSFQKAKEQGEETLAEVIRAMGKASVGPIFKTKYYEGRQVEEQFAEITAADCRGTVTAFIESSDFAGNPFGWVSLSLFSRKWVETELVPRLDWYIDAVCAALKEGKVDPSLRMQVVEDAGWMNPPLGFEDGPQGGAFGTGRLLSYGLIFCLRERLKPNSGTFSIKVSPTNQSDLLAQWNHGSGLKIEVDDLWVRYQKPLFQTE